MPRRRTALTVAIGALAGIASGLFGIGGGTIMVPAMVLVLAVAQREANAASLAAVIPIASIAVIPFLLAGEVELLVGALLAMASMSGAWIGARVMRRASDRALTAAFAIVMAVAIVQLLTSDPSAGVALTGPPWFLAIAIIGLIAGFAAALLGIGGGLILVPAMVIALGMPQHLAQGTSLLAIIPTALVGTWSHARHGLVGRDLVLGLAAGGVAGGLVGSSIALGLAGSDLRRAFAVFLAIVLARLVVTKILRRADRSVAMPPDAAPP